LFLFPRLEVLMVPLWAKVIATYLFSGYLPKAPGTWGTFLALPLVWVLYKLGEPFYVVSLILITFFGVLASDIYSRLSGKEDPDEVVIDEVAGVLVLFLFVKPTFVNLILGAILFRFIDILKPPPVNWFEKLGGGLGIMADDLVAGLIAGIILYSVQFLWT